MTEPIRDEKLHVLRQEMRAMAGTGLLGHDYLSTACLHGKHSECRKICKFCSATCGCDICNHVASRREAGPDKETLDAIVADLRNHYETDFDTTVPGEEFNNEIRLIVRKHLALAQPPTQPWVDVREVCAKVVDKKAKSFGGPGGQSQQQLEINRRTRQALKEAADEIRALPSPPSKEREP